jgi:hypothetical protein
MPVRPRDAERTAGPRSAMGLSMTNENHQHRNPAQTVEGKEGSSASAAFAGYEGERRNEHTDAVSLPSYQIFGTISIYSVHLRIRKSSGEMTRKLSDTASR